MIPSYKSDPPRIPYLQRQQQQESLYAMKPSINEISHEYIVGIRAVSANLKQLHEVVELSVYVSADLY